MSGGGLPAMAHAQERPERLSGSAIARVGAGCLGKPKKALATDCEGRKH